MPSPASPGARRRWLARSWRACLLAALAASVAGCVGMPNSGSPGTYGATPQNTTPAFGGIGAIPAGPGPGWTPSQIVTGFLNASASYPAYSTTAQLYLTGKAARKWDPGWSVQVVNQVGVPKDAAYSDGGRRAVVNVTGKVQASFNGSGQYVGAQQNRAATAASKQFTLVKVDGQWRIVDPPSGRMLTEPDFAQIYKPQDLYFFDPGGEVLVPDAVFVPAGTSPGSLVTNLVRALLSGPRTPWLQGAGGGAPAPAVTGFPGGTTPKEVSVNVDGSTATVNLLGPAANASAAQLEEISAQLVWTLTGQQQSQPDIQAVQLERNGRPWTPAGPPCPGAGGQSQGTAQKLVMYECYDPFPAATSSVFYYVDNGQARSRCAPENQVMNGLIGAVAPVFSRTSAALLAPPCKDLVHTESAAAPPPSQPRGAPPLSMITVSPDGKDAAGVAPNGKIVDVWPTGAVKPSNSLTTAGVTAIGWDRRSYLWAAEGDTLSVATLSGSDGNRFSPIADLGGKITGFSIAPDGVRVAAIVQTAGQGYVLDLAAINSTLSSSSQASGLLSGSVSHWTIGQAVRLGPNIANPIALTWYDADDLLVLDGTSTGATLWEVPVDGQPATKSPGVLPGAISITANSAKNALVVGLTGNQLEVSASLAGPWQVLSGNGQNPAFPVTAPVGATES